MTKIVEILIIQFSALSGDSSLRSALPEIPPNFDFVSSLQSTLLFSPKIAPNSVMGQLRALILDYFCISKEGSFIPLHVKRSALLWEAKRQNSFEVLDEAMSLNYKAEFDRMGREKIVPNFGNVDIRWIIVEIAYDKNSGVFCIGRKSGQDETPTIVFPPSEIVSKIGVIVESFEILLHDNDESFFVPPESKNNPDFVKKWWEERKRIDSGMAKIVQKLYREVFAPYSFLFKQWKRGNEIEEIIREIMQCIDCSSPIVSTFLHCNETPLTTESFESFLPLLGVSSIQPVSPLLLQKYNRFLLNHGDKIDLILVLSPSLQNLPFESMPCFSVSTISIYRHFCLQSISDCALPRESVTLRQGHYVLNISSNPTMRSNRIPSLAAFRRSAEDGIEASARAAAVGAVRMDGKSPQRAEHGVRFVVFDGIRSCRESFLHSGYLYMGHGSGSAYCSNESMLEGPAIRAVSFLLGCSSVRLGTLKPAQSAREEKGEKGAESGEREEKGEKGEEGIGNELQSGMNAEKDLKSVMEIEKDSKNAVEIEKDSNNKQTSQPIQFTQSSNPSSLSSSLTSSPSSFSPPPPPSLSFSLPRIDTVLYYLLKQAPAVVGCLWDVSDGDLDRITHSLLSHFLQTNKEHDLSQLTTKARAASLLHSLVGAAVVVYGLPTSCRMASNPPL